MSDSMSIEPEAQGVAPSFLPPITPPVTGTPGADQYLQSDGAGAVSWAPKPTPGTTIPAGTGWVKQTAPGTFTSLASVPAVQTSFSPSVPASWPIVVTEVDSALNSLEAQITSIAGQLNPLLPRVWFVDGGVASSGSGSIGAPFKAISAALAAASAGDLVWIAPGTYTENLTIPVDNLTLSGAGKNSTIIKAASGSVTPTLKCAPSSGTFTKLHVRNLTLQNYENGATGTGGEAGQCLFLDGNGLAVGVLTSFFTTACVLENVVLDKGTSTGDGYYLRTVDKLFVSGGNGSTILGNVAGWNCSGMLVNPGYGLFESTIVGNGATGFSLTYDDTTGTIRPTNGRQGIVFANAATIYGTVSLSKAPLFSMASDTALFGDLSAPAGSLSIFTSPYHGPSIRIAGQVGSPGLPCAVNIVSPAISLAAATNGAATYVDFSGAVLWLSSSKTFSVTGAVGAVRFQPVALGAKFLNLPEASATVKITANAETDLDIRKSYFRQDNLGTSGNGTIDRDSHRFGSVASPSSQTISPPFPAGATLTAVSTPTTAVAVGATVTSTTLTLVGTATVNAQVVRAA